MLGLIYHDVIFLQAESTGDCQWEERTRWAEIMCFVLM